MKLIKISIVAIVIVIMATISMFGNYIGQETRFLKEGDIIFQLSKSNQSNAIAWATKSKWTHCGIVIEKGNKLYVLEAIGKVSLTPIDKWVERGRFGHWDAKRIYDTPIKIEYKKYLGIPYDLEFKENNNKLYCSELVYKIYKDQFNKEICNLRKIKEYNTIGIKSYIKKRRMSLEQLVVAPSDLYENVD